MSLPLLIHADSTHDPDMFAAVFSENRDNARYIKSERISFMNAYSVICAGVLALLQSVQASDLI